ncbi:MAG: Calx-beta domain-containing protein, partial [Cyclobacteriaceae bacterium]
MKKDSLLLLLVILLTTSCSSDEGNSDPMVITYTASITSASSTTSLSENSGSTTFTVMLDKTNEGDAIPFELSFSGTATEDVDYSVSGATTIDDGSTSASFTLSATDDSDVESDEEVVITLVFAGSTNVTVGSSSSLTVTIIDDDMTDACVGTVDTYSIDMDASGCTESAESDLGVNSVYTVSVSGNDRTIVSNSIPDHNVGMFPNSGNPNTISVQDKTFVINANPSKNNNVTSLTTSNGQPRYWFGILDNSVILAPIANEFFTNTSTGENNTDWNENALSTNISLGTDCNNSHVFPTGR